MLFAVLMAVTKAPGMTAPPGSVTVPEILPSTLAHEITVSDRNVMSQYPIRIHFIGSPRMRNYISARFAVKGKYPAREGESSRSSGSVTFLPVLCNVHVMFQSE